MLLWALKGITEQGIFAELPPPMILSLLSSKTHVRWRDTVTLRLHTTVLCSHTALTHPQVLGVLVPSSPKTASMLIKIAEWPVLWWKSELLLSSLGGAHKERHQRVGLEMHLCPPSVVPVTVMSPTGGTVSRQSYKDCFQGRTCTSCVIFGARASYRQITSSSVSLAWMCSREVAGDDAIHHDFSIIQAQWAKGKHQVNIQRNGKEAEMTYALRGHPGLRCMHVLSGTDTRTEVLMAHVWSKESRVPGDFYLPTWFTIPVRYSGEE